MYHRSFDRVRIHGLMLLLLLLPCFFDCCCCACLLLFCNVMTSFNTSPTGIGRRCGLVLCTIFVLTLLTSCEALVCLGLASLIT